MTMPVIREAITHLDATSLMEWFMRSKGDDIQALSHFIFEDEALIAKITGAQVIPFITKLGAQADSPFSQKTQSMLASLSVAEILPADFYRYILLVRIYTPEVINTKLNEIAIRIEQEEAIRFIPVEEIISFAAMNSHLNKTICAALIRLDKFKDEQGTFQFTFNLKQLDRMIAALSESASPESQALLIKYMKGKMNSQFVDANLGSISYIHAVATIEVFLEHNLVPGPTARLVLFNLCKKNPQVLKFIQTNNSGIYSILKNIFTSEQKSILGMETPSVKTLPPQKEIEPKKRDKHDAQEQDNHDDQERRQNCSIM
jgi:hypothetical protein